MKKLSSVIAITLCLLFISMFPIVASASTSQVPNVETALKITKDDAQSIIDLAKQGDANAVKALNNLDCFNPEKIKQIGKMKVSSKEGSKEYVFNDGSSIKMTLGREISPANATVSSINYTDYAMHRWYVAGIEIARYIIHHRIIVASDFRHGWHDSVWDDSDALPGVYTVNEYGATLHSGNNFGVCWTLRGAGKFVNLQTGISSPKYIFEFVDDVAGNSHTLEVLYP